MNIELVKQEIEKLSTLISSWDESKGVSAIEQNLALDKLTSLYELIRFGNNIATDTTATPIITAPIANEIATDSNDESNEEEQEIEVEILFAEDEDEEETDSEPLSPEPEVEPSSVNEEPEVALVAATIEQPATPAIEEEVKEEAVENIVDEVVPAVDEQTKNEIESETKIEEAKVEVEVAPEPKPEVQPEPQQPKANRQPTMESLFGAEEIQRKPRSKHQRMMALYGEAQPKQEKAVDISKIFDMDDDDIFEIKVSANTPEEEPAFSTPKAITNEEVTTLADTIAPAKTTLADTIVAPAALAEEITNSKINSLQQAIGINDKFLMIRDLFNGDNEAYNEAITTLDKLPTLEDCMVHIIENYEWNPDVEGSKFIMQLLERKFS